VIDAATIVGVKREATDDHQVQVTVHDPEAPVRHCMHQSDFRANPRHVFNLYLTPEKREILARLDECPPLGDYFEVHEGVHSGNIRDELFVDRPLDKSCRELLFGRDEIAPYHVQWNGKYVRLSAVPKKKTRARYANAGKPEWYDQEKLLVRRTGDYVLAAVDRHRRYASNNFFIVFPTTPCSLDLDGLCALLNSRFMTWYFRTIEPRKGRVFAEIKIKHLSVFPLPPEVLDSNGCATLNELGRERANAAEKLLAAKTPDAVTRARRLCEGFDARINRTVEMMLGVDWNASDHEAANHLEVTHGSYATSH
jgi:hypothetical protein